MKKNTIIKACLTLLTSLSGLAVVAGTFSWFYPAAQVDNTPDDNKNINGEVMGAYFAYGDGVPSSQGEGHEPYGITKPRHLYNLAWLQYLGYFDGGQYYFEIGDDVPNNTLDMTGWTLPPIGTAQHPFLGHFDGNNKCIKGLTVSNTFAQYNTHPSSISNWNGSNHLQPEIVGLFGVVGELKTDLTYNTATNYIGDLTLENISISVNSTSHKALVGFVAGYANGTIDNVGVGSSKFNIAPNSTSLQYSDISQSGSSSYLPNISNYSTVGYCTPDYIKRNRVIDVSAESPEVVNGSAANLGNEFGASIPIKDIYDHLLSVKGSNTAQENIYSYPSEQTVHHDKDGNVRDVDDDSTITPNINGTTTDFLYSHSGTTMVDGNGNTIASYSFANRRNTDQFLYLSGQQTLDRYYLNGGIRESSNGAITTGVSSYPKNQTNWLMDGSNRCYITRGSTKYYLVYSNNATSRVALSTSYNSYAYTYSTSTKKFSYSTYNNSYYITLADNGALTYTTSSSSATAFERESVTSGGTTYYHFYKMFTKTVTNYYDQEYSGILICNTNTGDTRHYLKSTTSTSFTDTTSIDKYCFWTLDTTTGYLRNDVSNAYLYSSNGVLTAAATANNTDYYKWHFDDTNKCLYVGYQGTIKDLAYSNGWKLIDPSSAYVPYQAAHDETYYYFSHTYNNQPYYINAGSTNNSAVTTSITAETRWYINDNHRIYTVIDGTNYFLCYISNLVKVGISTSATWYYYYDSTNHRLFNSNSGYNSSNPYYMTWSNGSISGEDQTPANAAYIDQTTNTNHVDEVLEQQAVHNTNVTYRPEGEYIAIDETHDSATTTTSSYTTNPTYFPLKFNDAGTDIDLINTGYIVGGAYNNSSPEGDMRVSYYPYNNLTNSFGSQFGNDGSPVYNDDTAYNFEILTRSAASNGYVRISDSYNAEYNPNYTSNAIKNLSRMTPKELGFKKYTTARGYFHNALKTGGDNVYGLHFMDSQISTSHLITADRAMVNGWEYLPNGTIKHHVLSRDANGMPIKQLDNQGNPIKDSNGNFVYQYEIDEDDTILGSHKYELPEDSIDFNLSDNGTINFFAGSYFPGNKAFFSLHQIFRKSGNNKAEIDDIKEIRKIYLNTAYDSVLNPNVPRYVYQYDDNSYSAGTRGAAILFDMAWVTDVDDDMVDNMAYYFEIPVNIGEYALGSVSGRDGAYLMYLDIGASEMSHQITLVYEEVTTRTDYYAIPKGVDFTIVYSNGAVIAQDLVGGEVGTVIIPNGTNGDNITFTLDIVNSILTCGPPSNGSITNSTFINDGFTFTCNNTSLTANIVSTVTAVEDIITKYTYDADNSRLFKDVTVTTTTTTDGGSPVSDTGVNLPQERIDGIDEATFESTYWIALTNGTGHTYVEVKYYAPAGTTVSVKYLLTYDADEDEYCYIFIFDTDADIKVHVISVESGYNFMIRTVTNTSGGTSDQVATAGNTYTVTAKATS